MKKKFYITTTIPYANAPPHIGFALEIITADILARWNKLKGKDVFFLTGTDEHGTKNYQTAKKLGMEPKEFVDMNSGYFQELTKKLNISNTFFIRTTDKKMHWPGVLDIWKKLAEKGDIYKKKYTGFYCSGCERFVTEKDLVDEKCPDHPSLEIQKISEENYFFKLSKYSEEIKKIIEEDQYKIYPKQWKNDFLGLAKEGLTDVSFSREKKHLPWGIPVPGDDNQVMYVWCEALGNYLTGIGYPDKKYKKYWPCDVHVAGKDMHRFHAGIWTGMLLSLGLPLPKELIVHGFLTVNGRKMSKSVGNVVAPLELLEEYEADTLRYYLMRTIPFGSDGDFSKEALIDRHNNELANKLGNLVSRVSGLVEKNGMEKLGKNDDQSILYASTILNKKIEGVMDSFQFDRALNFLFEEIDICNEYIQSTKPWETKNKKILYEVANMIKSIAILLSPFIPSTSEKIAEQFGFKISWNEIKKPLLEHNKIKKGEILFKKI
ncbi:MAG: class I tRNA ligase family protein [Candidatus Pacearchaeota archaeon]|jgi:methionyl-tRNA synthetase